MDISLKLTVEEANVVLSMLQKGPYEVVASLIAKIKEQGDAQISAGTTEE